MYSITYRGIDGNDKKSFKNLGQVARYVEPRDQGSDYRRPTYLQGEFAAFYFDGFSWSDLLDGSPFNSETKYKPDLLALPENARLRWTKYKSRLRLSSDSKPEPLIGKFDGVQWAMICFDSPTAFRVSFGKDGHNDCGTTLTSLDEAKAWANRIFSYGEAGEWKRRGYWHGREGRTTCDYCPLRFRDAYHEGVRTGAETTPATVITSRPPWLG